MSGAPSSALTVVKVGGSLAADAGRLRAVLTRLADGAEGPAVIVPGGGAFADAVRVTQATLGFSDALAHRLALDAMGRMAEVFCAIEPRLTILRDPDVPPGSGTPVWDPAALRGGHPDIPERWDVTSDSLALWLAARIGASRCLLIKSAPCPDTADPAALARLGLVDSAFPDFAGRFEGAIVVRGPDDAAALDQGAGGRSSHLPSHPEVRGEAEPRRSAPARVAESGNPIRGPLERAAQDEGEDGIGERLCRAGLGETAA